MRVLLLSSFEPNVRPDTDLGSVLVDLLASLERQPGCEVTHREITSVADIERAVADLGPRVVWNACETFGGKSSNESVVPLVLERLGVPFTGASAQCLRHCLRKADATETLRAAGVPVPETFRVGIDFARSPIPASIYPVIVKPEREDGSVGIDDTSVVNDEEGLRRAVSELAHLGHEAVAQRFIEGREVVLALVGFPTPRVLSPGEILFDEEVFAGRARVLTYASKWDESARDYEATRSVGAETTPELFARLSSVARRAFDVLGMRDYGRVDFRVDVEGRPFVIDLNPNCDLSADGGFMRAFARDGVSHADAIGSILAGVIARATSAP